MCFPYSVNNRFLLQKIRGADNAEADLTVSKKPSQHFVIKLINPLSVAVVGILIRFMVILKLHKNIPKVIEHFVEVDNFLNYPLDYHKKDHKVMLHIVVIIFLISFPFETFSLFHTLKGDIVPTLLFGTNIYNNFSIFCCEFQFSAFCKLLYYRFRYINGKLQRLDRVLKKIGLQQLCKYQIWTIIVNTVFERCLCKTLIT